MATSTKKPAPANPWADDTKESASPDAPASEENGATPGDQTPADTADAAPQETPPETPETAPDEDTVIVEVPKAFQFMVDHDTRVEVKPGVQRMKKAHADHWWVKANGVKVFEG